jgi:hypothetical protein
VNNSHIPRLATEEEKEGVINFISNELFFTVDVTAQLEEAYVSAFDNVTLGGIEYPVMVSVIWAPGEAEAFVKVEDGSYVSFSLLES